MAIPTLSGNTLADCIVIRTDKNPNIIPITLPAGDSDETVVFDLLGVMKIITVEGMFKGSTVAAVKAKVDAIEALANGNQNVVAFVSDQTGTINVMVASVEIVWDLPGVIATYNIKLFQGENA